MADRDFFDEPPVHRFEVDGAPPMPKLGVGSSSRIWRGRKRAPLPPVLSAAVLPPALGHGGANGNGDAAATAQRKKKTPPGGSEAVADPSGKSLWKYAPGNRMLIFVRSVPEIDGARTEHKLRPGEEFHVDKEWEGANGILFLHLDDGRGWVFDEKPGFGTICVRKLAPKPPFLFIPAPTSPVFRMAASRMVDDPSNDGDEHRITKEPEGGYKGSWAIRASELPLGAKPPTLPAALDRRDLTAKTRARHPPAELSVSRSLHTFVDMEDTRRYFNFEKSMEWKMPLRANYSKPEPLRPWEDDGGRSSFSLVDVKLTA